MTQNEICTFQIREIQGYLGNLFLEEVLVSPKVWQAADDENDLQELHVQDLPDLTESDRYILQNEICTFQVGEIQYTTHESVFFSFIIKGSANLISDSLSFL